MDPTIEALTIHPAAWAALFQGLAEGIAYGLAGIASTLVVIAAVLVWFGGQSRGEEGANSRAEQVAEQPPAVEYPLAAYVSPSLNDLAPFPHAPAAAVGAGLAATGWPPTLRLLA